MRINLNEIPEEGRDWKLNRQTSELNEVLQDLISSEPYEAEFSIRPMQAGTFELKGQIKTKMPEDCSRCGEDFKWDVNESYKELLMPEMDQPRNSHFAKPNHVSDMTHEGPSVTEYRGQTFDIGEYLHEVVALSLPPVPAPPEDADGRCSSCKIMVRGCSFGFEDKSSIKTNPFAVLERLKKSQNP